MIIATETLSQAEKPPKQCKLLGATVRGLGVVVAVSSALVYGYAIVESADKVNRRVPFRNLKRDEVEFPAAAQSYRTQVERVDYGVWDEVHSLIPTTPVVLAVAA